MNRKNFFMIFCLFGALIFKIVLSAYSVYSFGFISIVNASITESSYFKGFDSLWAYLENLFYRFWLILPIKHPSLDNWLIHLNFPNIFEAYLLVLILKTPIIIFDFLCAYLVYILAKTLLDECKAFLAMLLWLFNPYITIIAEMDGTFEFIPTFFTILCFLFFIEKKFLKSILAYTSGIALKLSPILAFPIYAIIIHKIWGKKKLITMAFMTSIGILVYAYMLKYFGKDFLKSLLEYTPQTFHISEILLSPPIYTIGLSSMFSSLFLFILIEYWDWNKNPNSFFEATLCYFLILFAFFNWHPSYLILLIPFLIIDIFLNEERRVYVILWFLFAFLFSLIAFDYTPGNSIFFIKSHGEFANILLSFLKWIKEDKLMNLIGMPFFRSAFTGVSIFYALIIILENSSRIKKTILKMS